MNPLYHIYYFQTNIICIIITGLVLFGCYTSTKRDGVDESATRQLAWTNVAYCLTDILASYFRGVEGVWIKYLLYIVNIMFISAPLLFAYIFVDYSHYKLSGKSFFKTRKGHIFLIPIAISILIMISTPITHFAFEIDDKNLYQRSLGAYLVPIISWIYYIVTTIRLIVRILRSGNYEEKENLKPLAIFAIWPLIANITQLLFYGVTVTQVGFTLTILSFYIIRLKNQILNDDLTNLNNKRDFLIYINNFIRSSSDHQLYICMLDINHFKKINEKYGIAEGDVVLKKIGKIVRGTCMEIDHNIFVCRYGGDEFIIANKNTNQLEIDTIKMTIQENIQKENLNEIADYDISVSIGSAYGFIDNNSDFNELLERAKDDMIRDKIKSDIEQAQNQL